MDKMNKGNDPAVEAIKKRIEGKDDCCHVADDIRSAGRSLKDNIITDNKDSVSIEDYAKAHHSDVLKSYEAQEEQKKPNQSEVGGAYKPSYVNMVQNQEPSTDAFVRSPYNK